MRTSPSIEVRGPAAGGRAVVLLLHGGRVADTTPARRGLAWARMLPFAAAVTRATRGAGVAVWLLRYRARGWNAPAEDPIVDASWALAQARDRHPGASILLIGHSMGGRVALRLAGAPDVTAVCALAPWIEPGEPTPASPTAVLIAHGSQDHITDPVASRAYANRIGARFVSVPGENHAMLRHPSVWQRLVTGFVTSALATG